MSQPSKGKAALTLDVFRKQNKLPGVGCELSRFIATVTQSERAAIIQALKDRTIQAAAIHRVVAERGYTGGRLTIQQHRSRGCQTCTRLGLL